MANQSTQVAVDELKKLLNEKGEQLGSEVEEKIENLIAELQICRPHDNPAIKKIYSGFKCFKHCNFDKHPELFEQLAKEQNPKFLVFACSDSRVSPSHILGFQVGEAFMARNIANMIPRFDNVKHTGVGAIIEYAVGVLGVRNILVIGHSCCGGIKRLMTLPQDGSNQFDFVDEWVKIGLPAMEYVKEKHGHLPIEEQCQICEKESVKNSVRNLWSYPYVTKAVYDGNLKLWGGYYDFVKGCFEIIPDAQVVPVGPPFPVPIIPDDGFVPVAPPFPTPIVPQ